MTERTSSACAEEIHCLRSIVLALQTCVEKFSKRPQRSVAEKSLFSPSQCPTDTVGISECIEFVDLSISVIKSCPDHFSIQAVLFDAPYDYISTLTMTANSDCSYESLNLLRAKCLFALKACVSVCCQHQTLLSLLVSALVNAGSVDVLHSLITTATSPDDIRFAAAEALFLITMRTGMTSVNPVHFRSLLAAAPIESHSEIRSFLCGILREYIGSHDPGKEDKESDTQTYKQAQITEEFTSSTTITSLLKLMALDETADVRALSTSSLHVILSWSVQKLWGSPSESDQLLIAETICNRLASATSSFGVGEQRRLPEDDEVEALCRLVECTVHVACASGEPAIFKLYYHCGIHKHLLRVALRPIETAAAAIRALRLLVERAPTCFSISSYLLEQHNFAALLKVTLGSPVTELGHAPSVPHQIVAVDAAILIALALLFSPAARRRALLVATNFQTTITTLWKKLQLHLTVAALDYYEDIIIVDETNVVLNDEKHPALIWEGDTLSKESVRMIIEAQDLRVPKVNDPPLQMRLALGHWHDVERARAPHAQRGYMAFVLFGYVVTMVFNSQPQFYCSRPTFLVRHSDPEREHPEDAFISDYSPDKNGFPQAPLTPRQRRAKMCTAPEENEVAVASYPTHEAPRYPVPPPMRRPIHVVEDAPLKGEFDACMQLVLHFSEHFLDKRRKIVLKREKDYIASGTGLVQKRLGDKVKLVNPWDPRPKERHDVKSWTIGCVEEGDLFFFSIPLQALTVSVVEAVVTKARNHQKNLRRLLSVIPQAQKIRRHFLEDLSSNVLPNAILLLQRVNKFLAQTSESHVQMALAVLPSIINHRNEKCIHCGNLVAVTEYLQNYFSKRVPSGTLHPSPSSSNATGSLRVAPVKDPSSFNHLAMQGLSTGRDLSTIASGDLFPDTSSPRILFDSP